MEAWPIVPLSELVDPSRGITYGIVQPGEHYRGGIPIIRVTDLKGNTVDKLNPMRVKPEIEASYARTRLRGGELIMSIVGTVGRTAIVDSSLVGWNVARAIAVVPVREDVGAIWVRLCMQGGAALEHIESRLNTTVQATLNLRDLSDLPIQLPPPNVRNAIARVICALDDKIELNRRTNETIEAMASALFKDWFVDFGPTRTKMRGQAPYLVADAWEAFPGGFDNAGMPEGWRVYRLSDLAVLHTASVNPQQTPDAEFEHFSLPAYDSGQTPAVDFGRSIKSNKTVVPQFSVLLSKLNPEIPRVWLPASEGARVQICSTEFLAMTPTSIASRSLLYGLFNEVNYRKRLVSTVTGTSKSHQRISPPGLMSSEVLIGDQSIFALYADLTDGLLRRTVANRAESQMLAAVRDFLLPKMMAGDISIRNAERAIGEVA